MKTFSMLLTICAGNSPVTGFVMGIDGLEYKLWKAKGVQIEAEFCNIINYSRIIYLLKIESYQSKIIDSMQLKNNTDHNWQSWSGELYHSFVPYFATD